MTSDDKFDLDAAMVESARLMKSIDAGDAPDVDQLYSLFKTQHHAIIQLMKWVATTAEESLKRSRAEDQKREFEGDLNASVWRFAEVAIDKGLITEEDAAHIFNVDDPIKALERWLGEQADEGDDPRA